MSADQLPAVVGVFNERRRAEEAVEALRQAGFPAGQVGLVTRHGDVRENAPAEGNDSGTKMEEGARAGVFAGGAVGGFLGALATGLVPGVGPVLAVGALAGVLGGLACGAAGGGLVGTMIGMGIPEQDARFYNRELVSGRTLVTVRSERRSLEATAILRRHGAFDTSAPGYTAATPSA